MSGPTRAKLHTIAFSHKLLSPKPVEIAFKRFAHFCLTRRWMALYSSWWITHAMKWFAAPVHQRFLVIWKSFRRVSLCTKFNMSQVTWSKSQCEVYISIIRGQRFQRSFCIWFINDVNQIFAEVLTKCTSKAGHHYYELWAPGLRS